MLYLYIPSIFISAIIGIAIIYGMDRKNLKEKYTYIITFFVLFSLLLLTEVRGVKVLRSDWKNTSMFDKRCIENLKKIKKPTKGANIYVRNANKVYNIFQPYGPGFINNIVFNDVSLKTFVGNEKVNKSKPYLILRFNQKTGKIDELKRNR